MADSTLTMLDAFLPKLEAVVKRANDEYLQDYAHVAEIHCKTTRAGIIHDHMVRAATILLREPDFIQTEAAGRKVVVFRDVCVIQLKKFSDTLTTSNYRTAQARRLSNSGQMELSGISSALPLYTLGYIPGAFGLGVEGVYLTQTVEGTVTWWHRLGDDDSDAQIPMPISPNEPVTAPRRRIRGISQGDLPFTGTGGG